MKILPKKKNWKIKYFTYLNSLSKSLIKCLIPQSNGGELKEGKFDENIIYYFYDGKEYNGEFNNGFFNGKTILFYENDKFYNYFEGIFKNGKKEGFGKMIYLNGDEYEGNWENDKKEVKENKI